MKRALEYTKFFRDQVLGFIGVTNEERGIIDTKEFQRLRRIKQLDMADLVYPNACHSRFGHSLGVMTTASKMAEEVFVWREIQTKKRRDLEDERRILGELRIAALLHDIGHYTMSHPGERALKEVDKNASHVKLAHSIMKCTDLNNAVSEALDKTGSKLNATDILSHEADWESFIYQILDSDIDADKIDYLIRDAHNTGVVDGVFDRDRLLKMLRYDYGDLVIDRRGVNAIESYIIARYEMYNQVYFHKTVSSYGAIVQRLIRRLIEHEVLPSYQQIDGTPDMILHVDDYSFIQFARDSVRGILKNQNEVPVKDCGIKYLSKHILWRNILPLAMEKTVLSPPDFPNDTENRNTAPTDREYLELDELWKAAKHNELDGIFAKVSKRYDFPFDGIVIGQHEIPIHQVISRSSTDEKKHQGEIILMNGHEEKEQPRWLLDLVSGASLKKVLIFAPRKAHSVLRKEVQTLLDLRVSARIEEMKKSSTTT